MDLVLSLALSVLLATFVFLSRASRFPLPIPLPIHAFLSRPRAPFSQPSRLVYPSLATTHCRPLFDSLGGEELGKSCMATASSVSPAYSTVCIMYSSLQNRTLACLSFTYFSPGASLCVHQVMLGKVPKGEVDIQAKAESESECIWSVAISAEPELTARKGLEKPPSRRNSAELWLLARTKRAYVYVRTWL